jgi:Beta-propeller repeat/Putative binding domain, N-terminal
MTIGDTWIENKGRRFLAGWGVARGAGANGYAHLGWILPLATIVCCAVSAEPPKAPVARHAYDKVPLSFEENRGQTDARVKFLARASGYTLFVATDEAVFAGSDGSVERMKLIGASPKLKFEPLAQQPGISNYFIGNDPTKWRTNVPNFGRVALRGVYPGIDLIFYSKDRQLEYDWMVAPGADPKQIRVKWEGPKHLTKNASGDLVLTAALVQKKPVILQDGMRIAGGYAVHGRQVSFELAKYDASKPLLIDPVFVYSTYWGGGSSDGSGGIAVDGAGNAYVTGSTSSVDFPTKNPLQGNGFVSDFNYDAFVTKFNSTGSAVLYSTFLGGSGADSGSSIAVDGVGNAYVTGGTDSHNFPTNNAMQASNRGSENGFVTKISPAGSALVYSTYLGGSGDLNEGGDYSNDIAVDGAGNAYVTGTTGSSDFPTVNALQTQNKGARQFYRLTAFVSKINPLGSAFMYSTYLGGSAGDSGSSIAVDTGGNAYVAGTTSSSDFPTRNALQPNNLTPQGILNLLGTGFVSKINAAGSALVYSTYLGGSGDEAAYGIAVDSAGNAYVTGRTGSNDFPTVNALQPSKHSSAGNSNAYVSKINPAGSAFVYSTYLGGSTGDGGSAIAVDGFGNVYVGGSTYSTDFPLVDPLQSSNHAAFRSGGNAFVSKVNAAGSALVYSTYIGGSTNNIAIEFGGSSSDSVRGIAVDGVGNAYVAGGTGSPDFPTSNALHPSLGGIYDAFVLAISPLNQLFAAAGQAISGSGGSGSLNFSLPVDFAWTASTNANWLTITGATSGSGSGTITYQAAPNPGDVRSALITVGGLSFTIEQEAGFIPGIDFIGSMPHFAAAENWTTTFTLVNKGAVPAEARLTLFGDPAGPLTVPLTFPQQNGGTLLAQSLDRTLGPNGSLVIKTAGPQTPPVLIGSAALAANGPVDGFAIMHHVVTGQETVMPMETRTASSFLLAFDNTGGNVLGVAVANVSAEPGTVEVIVRDDAGLQIASGSLAMAGNGHLSFVLPLQYPATAKKRGTIEFDAPPDGRISAMGMRFTPPNNALTTIPPLVGGTNGSGSIAHLATGNGWKTTFVLVNTGTSAAPVQLKFFADNGSPLALPVSYPQSSSSATTVPSVSQTLAAGATLLVESAAPLSNPTPTIGSAQLTSTGSVSGFVIFRFDPTGQEAVVPFESRNANGYILAFDNTAGTATGVAINNASSQAVNVPVVIRNDNGEQIATETYGLAGNGNYVFTMVTDKYPGTAGIRGTIEFDTPPGGQIGALAFRFPVTHTFTTLPALAR